MAVDDEHAHVKYTVNQIGCVTFAHPCILEGTTWLQEMTSAFACGSKTSLTVVCISSAPHSLQIKSGCTYY